MRVHLRTPISIYSGYGNDGVGITKALLKYQGLDVRLHTNFVQAPIPQEIANLLTKPIDPPFDLSLQHVDPLQLFADESYQRNADINVGWSMWERTAIEKSDIEKNSEVVDELRDRWKGFDVILAYDEVSREALSEFVSPDTKLAVLQGGYEPERWPELERDWDGPFRFCMVGQLGGRKDPFTAIQAYKELKDEGYIEDAEFHLKTNTKVFHPVMQEVIPKLKIHYATWSEEVLQEFYRGCHVLISCSRGEGKNMPALEFMSTGGTCIVSKVGGHMQWYSPDIAYGVDGEMKPVSNQSIKAMDFRVDKEHLKTKMRLAYEHRDQSRQKGLNAARVVPAMCSWDNVIRRFWEVLRDVGGEKGEALYAKRSTLQVDSNTHGQPSGAQMFG